MATGQANHSRRRWFGGRLEALFDEAWALERSRRGRSLLWLAALLAALALGLGLVSGRRGSHSSVTGPDAAISHRLVSSARLPRSGEYSSLAVVGGRLLVWSAQGAEDSAPEAVVPPGTCEVAQVDPSTLALDAVRRGSCANPALYGERVLTDFGTTRGGDTGDIGSVRVSVRTTGGGYRVGPVLLRYPVCSDCQVSWIYGDGSLWVYSPVRLIRGSTNRETGSGELLRISERTGRVAQRWAMPSLIRALLATDRDGLWIAPSLYSGEPEHLRRGTTRDYESLYRVAAGMRTPQRTYLIGRSGARWLVASGSSVWLQAAVSDTSRQVQLAGPDAAPVSSVLQGRAGAQCDGMGEGPTSVVSDGGAGIYCVGSYPTSDLWTYSATGSRGHRVARLALPKFGGPEPTAIVRHAFFLLEPPTFAYGPGTSRPTADGPATLYRIRVR